MDKIQQGFIKTALDYPEKLSEWESEFVDSLAGKNNDYRLTKKQADVLNRISQKYINTGWD